MKLNLSDVEVRDFDPLPVGNYTVRITDWEPRESHSEKNPGKWYLNVEMTVIEGQYEDRKCWTNVNFMPQALFSLKGIAVATGTEAAIEALETTGADENYEEIAALVGQVLEDANAEFVVKVRKGKPYVKDGVKQEGNNEVKGFAPVGSAQATATAGSSGGGGNPLLP
jgi:hypothetical protein